MKKGLTQICLGGNSLIRDALQLCKEIGYQGLEILLTENGELTMQAGQAEYAALRRMSQEAGVELTSICGAGSFTDNDPAVVAQSKAQCRKMLEAAEALGIDTILVTGGRVTETVPYDVAYDRLLSALQELRADAERHRVHLALENIWNKLLISPLEFRDFLDKIGSPYVGCYFDTGNVVLYGYPEQWIRILGQRIKKIHFKDFKMDHRTRQYEWSQLMQGEVNWPAVMREIRAIGYDDYVITEVCGDRATYEETCRVMDTILALA
ncbi:MAG TPA: sugar phosphate isomerase/epimerase family protein [Chthonomonadaceae bacterium]|jgi:hexulose-6-phosphate isomerase|nr:sugar phosphate isomerase/epimerase family protein [Chthonomonadaceae bacterium]